MPRYIITNKAGRIVAGYGNTGVGTALNIPAERAAAALAAGHLIDPSAPAVEAEPVAVGTDESKQEGGSDAGGAGDDGAQVGNPDGSGEGGEGEGADGAKTDVDPEKTSKEGASDNLGGEDSGKHKKAATTKKTGG